MHHLISKLLNLIKNANEDNFEEVLAEFGNQLQSTIKTTVIYLCTDTYRKATY